VKVVKIAKCVSMFHHCILIMLLICKIMQLHGRKTVPRWLLHQFIAEQTTKINCDDFNCDDFCAYTACFMRAQTGCVRFMVNRKIFLVGFGLYGSIEAPAQYTVNIQVSKVDGIFCQFTGVSSLSYLPPNASECTLPKPSWGGWYSILHVPEG